MKFTVHILSYFILMQCLHFTNDHCVNKLIFYAHVIVVYFEYNLIKVLLKLKFTP